MSVNANLPPYVEFGARTTAPAPFECKGGSFRCLVLEGEAQKIKALCDRMLNVPAAGKVQYEPLGHFVVMVLGPFAELRSLAPHFNAMGFVSETQLSLWMPLAAGRSVGGIFVPERFAMACPYVFVDNPMSLLNGREEFGYAKAMGAFEPAKGLADKVEVSAFGGDFATLDKAGWNELFVIEQTGPPGASVPIGIGLPDIAAELTVLAITEALGSVFWPESSAPEIVGEFIEALLKGAVNQVALKQFRDAADSSAACYQAVVEVPVRWGNLSMKVSFGDWQMTLLPVESYPVAEELGVSTQTLPLCLELEADMILEPGVVVAP